MKRLKVIGGLFKKFIFTDNQPFYKGILLNNRSLKESNYIIAFLLTCFDTFFYNIFSKIGSVLRRKIYFPLLFSTPVLRTLASD